ncbi:MAG: hypothetical protein DRH89_01615 [Candidatus Cloacimonadota bacterium]|nr:MAG: hypothetical protein DRH89_01615 [Candidatus Cloacimonadota bacterium]
MSAGWGWVDFSTEDRNRISSIMSLLKDQGILDELGISVLRDAISNKLFPGLSTIQTRAKYFLFTPVIVRKYYHDQQGLSLPEYFSKNESEFIQETVIGSANENGIFGSTLTDAKNLQRKPSSIYWNGQRTLGIIKLRQKNVFLSQYLRMNSLDIDNSLKTTDDSFDGNIENNTGIFLPNTIIRDFEPSDIMLTKEEAAYLRNAFIETLKESEPDSLLYAFLTDEELLLKLTEQNTDFYNFYDEFCLSNDYQGTLLKQYMDLAYYFSEVMYGAHLLYNVIIQKKANTPDNPYSKEWNEWKSNISSVLDKLDMVLLKELVENDPHNSIKFLDNWVENIKSNNQKSLEELVIEQEFKCKKERARLKRINLPPEECQNWIGMRRMNYRIYQTRVICSDLYKGGAYA